MNKVRYWVGAALALCLPAGVATADDTFDIGRNGIEIEVTDDIEINIGGRLHLDTVSSDSGATTFEDTDLRRARLEVSVELFDDLTLRVDREFADPEGWRNVWARYEVSRRLAVQVGNFIAPFSQEDGGSSNDIMFMERSLSQGLAPSFGLGGGATYEGRRFTLSGGYFGDALNDDETVQAEKGTGFTGRATYSPLERRRQTLHLGLGLDRRSFDTGDVRRISTRPEASLGNSAIATGAITDLDASRSYNVEAGYLFGSFLVQGQYIQSTLERTAGLPDLEFDGYYGQIGWVVTGERHRYSDRTGTFSGPNPRGKFGAVQLAARYSSLDLSQAAGANAGEATSVTGGVNWYINQNVRLMANYVTTEVDANDPLRDRDVDTIQARAQFDF